MALTKEEILERDKSLERLQITIYRDKKGYVFVSYKSDNWKQVFEGKVFELQKNGLRVYSDKNFDDTNHPWLEDMDRNLKYSSAVLLFISKEYLKSYATLIELFTAIKYKKQIVPIYLEDKRKLFNDLKDDIDLEDEIVKMQPSEADTLSNLLGYTDNKLFADKLRLIKRECDTKIQQQKFSVMNIVEAFEKILDDADMKDNLFDKSIESLINTIKDATSQANGVFENNNLLLEAVEENACVQNDESNETEMSETQDACTEADMSLVEEKDTAKKKASSVTGDITYSLYGEEYTENQSDMMLRFFAQVLKRHQDIVVSLPEYKGMNCVSKIDYTQKENVTSTMPSYFRNCQYFEFDNGAAICVGTAYGISDKLKKMATLLQIVEEDEKIFSSEQVELPKTKALAAGALGNGQGNSSSVSYQVFGKSYTTNQTDMMGNVFRAFIEKHPELLAEIAENFTCVAMEDYSDVSKENKPVYFGSCNVYEIDGKKYTIGGSYGMKDKVKLIERLIAYCAEPATSVVIEGVELKETKKSTKAKSKKNFL